jgi:hypothetical protein
MCPSRRSLLRIEIWTAIKYLGLGLGIGEENGERRTKSDTDKVRASSFVDPSSFVIYIEEPSYVFHTAFGHDDYQPRYDVLIKGRG